MTALRRVVRACVPYELRLQVALARREWRDRRTRTAFAARPAHGQRPAFEHSAYELAFIDYPGQERLARAKRHNQRLLGDALDGTVLQPGETFSLWRLSGRPTAAAGYAPAAAIRSGVLTTDMGGSICLLSTVVYNAALLAGLEIVERYAHSVDTYGDERYFELGRDCAIEYGYRDLRFRNPFDYSVALNVDVDADRVRVAVGSASPRDFTVELAVSEPLREAPATRLVFDSHLPPGREAIVDPGYEGLSTQTTRTITWADGRRRRDALGESRHHSAPRVIARGRRRLGAIRRADASGGKPARTVANQSGEGAPTE